MQQESNAVLSNHRMAPHRAERRREQEVQKVIKGLEEEMRRLVELLVAQTNH